MADSNFLESLKTARNHGLGEFLEILSELSTECTKKGHLDRKMKELIILGIAYAKNCNRCIAIHTEAAKKLGATEFQLQQAHKVTLYTHAYPSHSKERALHIAWEDSWNLFSMSRGCEQRYCRELIGLGVALIQHNAKLINMHVHHALELGATADEVFEVMPIALMMDGTPTLSQLPHLTEAIETARIALALDSVVTLAA